MSRRILSVLVLFLALGLAGPAYPQVPAPQTPEGLLSFARTLLALGESFRAATEYMRFLHHYPSDDRTPQALEGLGRAYAQAGRWTEAVAAFSRLQSVAPGAEPRHLLGSALYEGGRYQEAARVLLAPETGEAGSILGTLAVLRVGSEEKSPLAGLPDLTQEFRSLHRKSPGTAGTLSAVLPGAGHLYAGRPRDALVSLVVNGVFIWGTYESARRGQWALAGILGLFETGWYTGNVVSSVNAAHKWNRREEGRFFNRWEETARPQWGIMLAPGAAGLGVAWSW